MGLVWRRGLRASRENHSRRRGVALVSWYTVDRPTGKIASQVVAFGVSRGILLVATVLTAREAGVEAYGVFALALVVFQAGVLLRDAGLGQALIVLGGRERGLTLPAAIAISGIGSAIGLLMWYLAVPLTSMLGLPGAAPILRTLALAFVIGSLGIASNATLERELRFVARAVIDIVAYGALGVVTVIGLAGGYGVESLAWGFVVQAILQAGLGIILAPPWVDRGGSLAGLIWLARYSLLLWGSAGLSYLAANLDNGLLARLAGAAALGVYALSYVIGNTITIGIAQVLNRVALPYYGRDHDNALAIERTLRSVLPLSVVLAAIPTTIIVALAPEIGPLVFPPGTSVLPMTLLAVYGMVRTIGMSLGTALNGIGAARETVVGSAINVVLMVLTIPAAISIAGPTGVATVVLAAMVVSSAYLALGVRRRLGVEIRKEWLRMALGICLAVAAALFAPTMTLPVRLVLGGLVILGLVSLALRISGLRPGRRTRPDVASTS